MGNRIEWEDHEIEAKEYFVRQGELLKVSEEEYSVILTLRKTKVA
jgi:hypothetical protein